jgi:protein SCO1/2
MKYLLPACMFLLATACHAEATTNDAAALGWRPAPGVQVPLDTVLRDETGRAVSLHRIFGGAPVILDLGYFHCPSLCGVVRADLLRALQGSGLIEGRDYSLLSLSIDPAEMPDDAAHAKQADLAQSPFASGADWHYMTGTADAVGRIANAVGFRDRYDSRFRQFLHPTGLVVLTRAGMVSGYLLGVGYTAGDLRAAVMRARDGGVARDALPILLLCFHFDPSTGRYTLAIEKLLRLTGLFTVLTLGGTLLVLHRHRPAPKP